VTIASLVAQHGKSVSVVTKATDSIDSAGGRVEAWSTATVLTGFVQVRANSDAVTGGAERPARLATIYFEGRPTVAVADRISYDSTTWAIRSVRVPDEREASDALGYTIVEASEVFG
jgi:head-tail adaptor